MIGLELILQMYNKKSSKIAKVLGINRTTVHDWLKGKRKIPKDRVKQLSDYFELDEHYFQKELNDEMVGSRKKEILLKLLINKGS